MPRRLVAWLLMASSCLSSTALAQDWWVVWKDETTELRVDRDSVRVDGSTVEYWYSDTVDALVDWMEHRYHAVSDCGHGRLQLLQMHDPETGETKALAPEWRDVSDDPDGPMAVMHADVCRAYAAGRVG